MEILPSVSVSDEDPFTRFYELFGPATYFQKSFSLPPKLIPAAVC